MEPNWKHKTVFTGDNLYVMRGMNSESVDLLYLDPPFNSNRAYAAPIGSKAAGAAFKDTWTLSDVDLVEHNRLKEEGVGLYTIIEAAGRIHSKGMFSYLVMMAVRLFEMKRILKDTGSIYLHCDDTANSYLRLLMDGIFGAKNFRNEIIWHYHRWTGATKHCTPSPAKAGDAAAARPRASSVRTPSPSRPSRPTAKNHSQASATPAGCPDTASESAARNRWQPPESVSRRSRPPAAGGRKRCPVYTPQGKKPQKAPSHRSLRNSPRDAGRPGGECSPPGFFLCAIQARHGMTGANQAPPQPRTGARSRRLPAYTARESTRNAARGSPAGTAQTPRQDVRPDPIRSARAGFDRIGPPGRPQGQARTAPRTSRTPLRHLSRNNRTAPYSQARAGALKRLTPPPLVSKHFPAGRRPFAASTS